MNEALQNLVKVSWNTGIEEVYVNHTEATKAIIDSYINDLIDEYSYPKNNITVDTISQDLKEIVNLIDYGFIKNYACISDIEVKTYHICDFSEAADNE